MKAITILTEIILLFLLFLLCGCTVLFNNAFKPTSQIAEPILMSSEQALDYLEQKNIFLQQVFLVFDLNNRPTVRWSGTDSVSGKVYSIDTFAKNIVQKPFETASRILEKLYLAGKPYKVEKKQNNFILVPQ